MYSEELILALEKFYKNVNSLTSSLHTLHAGKLNCKIGCSGCCIDNLEVFGIEAEYIKRTQKTILEAEIPHPKGKCAFLDSNGACRIYESRPLICRTHGLPIAWKDSQEEDGVEYRDICELNIDMLPPENLASSEVLPIDYLDEKLAYLQLIADQGKLEKASLRALFKN